MTNVNALLASAGFISFAASLSSLRIRVNPFASGPARALLLCEVGSREDAKEKEGAKKGRMLTGLRPALVCVR